MFYEITKRKRFWLLEIINLLCYYTRPIFIGNKKITIIFIFFRSQPILEDSSGKSGAKFYQSYDKLFIIKTLTGEEVERMNSFLKHYHPECRNYILYIYHIIIIYYFI